MIHKKILWDTHLQILQIRVGNNNNNNNNLHLYSANLSMNIFGCTLQYYYIIIIFQPD